jgi:ABC-2 type transport system ATP-binding protein
MSTKPIIRLQGLTKRYPRSTEVAVDHLNLEIEDGEIFGLLGPNGAGKTTTISILCNQLNPTEGRVFIENTELTKGNGHIKQIIGVVPQDIALYPSLTAGENLSFFGNMYGLRGKYLQERIKECAANFGLDKNLNQKIRTFSGGMKRRVNLIAGMLHQPRILILDEPTVGIDVQSKAVIIEYLASMNRQQGTTIVYTSHLMEEAEHFCTRVGIIDHGKLIASGNPKQLVLDYPNCEKLEDIFLLLTGRNLRD